MASDGETDRMPAAGDFEKHEAYRTATEIVNLVYDLEDRFPQDELALLFFRLRACAVEVGAAIAQGVGREGLDAVGSLSENTRREARAKLAELRHYVLTAHRRFFLDERQLLAFEDLHAKLYRAVAPAGKA